MLLEAALWLNLIVGLNSLTDLVVAESNHHLRHRYCPEASRESEV